MQVMTRQAEQSGYTLVVGLGKTGLSVVRHLHACGERVIVADSRDIPPGLNELKAAYSDVGVYTGAFDEQLFLGASRIITSPGVALSEPVLCSALENDIEVVGDIDLFAENVRAPVIAITGSNGKSTVTELVAKMAQDAGVDAVACGNIGLPVLDALESNAELYVIELSSFQLETLKHLDMRASVVLNISADHLDRYDSLQSYADSKRRIYRHTQTCVVNLDDELACDTDRAGDDDCNRLGFTSASPSPDSFGIRDDALYFDDERLIAVDEVMLKGLHNMQNVMAALALGKSVGLPMSSMLETLRSFKGLHHRMQFVAEIDGVNWINDSKATNVGACIAALTGLPGQHVLLAGGIAKDADFSALGDVIVRHCRAVVLFGRDAEQIAKVLPEPVRIVQAASMHDAVQQAHQMAQAGDNVMLSPACASFDMFDNFEHRGDVFMREVIALGAGVRSANTPHGEVPS